MRSQYSFSETIPAAVGGAAWSARLQRKAALREPPRPSSPLGARDTDNAKIVATGMQAAANRSISLQMLPISRA